MKIYPDLSEFKFFAEKYNVIPVFTEILADLETPVSAFLKLRKGPYNFLLESAEQEEKTGRYSFIGFEPELVIKGENGKVEIINTDSGGKRVEKCQDLLKPVEGLLKNYNQPYFPFLPKFTGGFVGYISYDFVRYIEKLPDLTEDTVKFPEIYFILVRNIVIFDHFKRKIILISNAFPQKDKKESYSRCVENLESMKKKLEKNLFIVESSQKFKKGGKFKSNFSKDEFKSIVKRAKRYIYDGDIIQVVLSQRWEREIDVEPFYIYRMLRSVNPSPYMFYLELGNCILIGSSPEILVRLEGKKAIVRPIAGTRRRGKDEKEDMKLQEELLNNEKERAEHIMLVDLGRNDLGRVCKPGTVKVTELMKIEKYSHVMHIVSNVEGEISRGKNQFHLLKSSFPAGTVTGAPKIRAMEIIEELENEKRGPYAGAVGYFSFNKDIDFCITIRTFFIKDNKVYVQAGAGIVADSDPEMEYQETVNKVRALTEAYNLSKEI
ncbi:MAG: anthranilate synthase component I [Candidatus Omnitrophota bacterium]|nr:MAG: anthranilate synthase component I [Candidatus Omnitrophota bacterium]